VVIFSKKLN